MALGKRLKTHDLRHWMLTFGSYNIRGFGDGDAFSFEFGEGNLWELAVGAGGEACRSRSLNLSGTVTVTVMASADIVNALNAIRAADMATSLGYFPFFVKHLNSTTQFFAKQAYIKNLPSIAVGDEIHEIEFVIEANEWTFIEGGYFT